MYLDYFGLVSDPFALSPNPNLLFLSQSHEEAMAHLAYGLEQGEEIILLTGSIGMGKTLAVQCLENRISSKFHCIVVSSTNMEFRDLLKLILLDLSISITPNPDLADLHIAFKKMLQNEHEKGRNLLLIIDEAQNLSPDSLESFRLLLSIAPTGNTNLNIVFAGQPGLNQLINLPELAQLRQRIRVHYHMEPLSKKEIKSYLNFRTNECGQEKHLFKDNAIDAIFELSKGVPRLVNHLASQALLSAYVDEASSVSRKHLSEVELPGKFEDPINNFGNHALPHTNIHPLKNTQQPSTISTNPTEPIKKSNSRKLWIIFIIIAIISALFFSPPINTYILSFLSQPKSFSPGSISKNSNPDSSLPIEGHTVPVISLITPKSNKTEKSSTTLDSIFSSKIEADKTNGMMSDEPTLYTIHIASFRDENRAQQQVTHIVQSNYPAFFMPVEVEGQKWFRVFVGKFSDIETAKTTKNSLKEKQLIRYSSIIEL